jgi:hypothetical protein
MALFLCKAAHFIDNCLKGADYFRMNFLNDGVLMFFLKEIWSTTIDIVWISTSISFIQKTVVIN